MRAGLRIVEAAEALEGVGGVPLRLRVGINTGEALVRLGVSASSGEGFTAGDAINTASRIQSVAPVMGVGVGLATYEATSAVFDYEEIEPAVLKGKTEPVRVFHAQASRARLGTDVTRTHDSPFIGREIDLALLKGIFDKAVAGDSVQLVTVVGEPGLGKSRLVAELLRYVDAEPDLVTWRQGRCLPYGEGITFWALGEILKAHAGVLESDAPQVASEKLDRVLGAGPEREWFRQRLLPLLGGEASSSAEREELFTAWRRFLSRLGMSGRRCWCLRICIGLMRRCSRFSSIWPMTRSSIAGEVEQPGGECRNGLGAAAGGGSSSCAASMSDAGRERWGPLSHSHYACCRLVVMLAVMAAGGFGAVGSYARHGRGGRGCEARKRDVIPAPSGGDALRELRPGSAQGARAPGSSGPIRPLRMPQRPQRSR